MATILIGLLVVFVVSFLCALYFGIKWYREHKRKSKSTSPVSFAISVLLCPIFLAISIAIYPYTNIFNSATEDYSVSQPVEPSEPSTPVYSNNDYKLDYNDDPIPEKTVYYDNSNYYDEQGTIYDSGSGILDITEQDSSPEPPAITEIITQPTYVHHPPKEIPVDHRIESVNITMFSPEGSRVIVTPTTSVDSVTISTLVDGRVYGPFSLSKAAPQFSDDWAINLYFVDGHHTLTINAFSGSALVASYEREFYKSLELDTIRWLNSLR